MTKLYSDLYRTCMTCGEEKLATEFMFVIKKLEFVILPANNVIVQELKKDIKKIQNAQKIMT